MIVMYRKIVFKRDHQRRIFVPSIENFLFGSYRKEYARRRRYICVYLVICLFHYTYDLEYQSVQSYLPSTRIFRTEQFFRHLFAYHTYLTGSSDVYIIDVSAHNHLLGYHFFIFRRYTSYQIGPADNTCRDLFFIIHIDGRDKIQFVAKKYLYILNVYIL